MPKEHCEVCGNHIASRRFSRRGYMDRPFCSITCVEAFEMRAGLPNGRIYETRPGWSHFPVAAAQPALLPC